VPTTTPSTTDTSARASQAEPGDGQRSSPPPQDWGGLRGGRSPALGGEHARTLVPRERLPGRGARRAACPASLCAAPGRARAPPPRPAPRAPPRATAAAPAAAPAAQPARQPLSPPVNLKVGVLGLLTEAGMYIALEKGYFREEGLELELVPFARAAEQMP